MTIYHLRNKIEMRRGARLFRSASCRPEDGKPPVEDFISSLREKQAQPPPAALDMHAAFATASGLLGAGPFERARRYKQDNEKGMRNA